jgi:hypothetical protein
LEEVDAATLEEVETVAPEEVDYNKLRVADLKKIANNSLLTSSSKINSMKKQELIDLITTKGSE